MSKKIVIVGGVAGGASTAARLRRLDEEAEIIIFEKGEYISFANCGLPYHIGEVIEKRSRLLIQTPEAMAARFRINVHINHEVVRINREKKTVEVKDLNKNESFSESYDFLILSPGAEPVKPPIKGVDHPRVFTLRNIPDMDEIKGYIDKEKPARAVVVGGGYIGLEMAENLHARGLEVTLVEMLDQVLSPIDYEMATMVHNHMRMKGVKLHLGDGITGIAEDDNLLKVILQSENEIKTDLVILAIGVRPSTKLAREAGLELGKRGGIKVNTQLQTSDQSIYALGDAIEVIDFMTGEPAVIPLAGPANKQGRIVADNINGRQEEYEGTQGTAIAKVFDLTVGSTGINEKKLKNAEIDYQVSYTNSSNHAGYYPGASPMFIKLLFKPDKGELLGAQIVGHDGVDKRIDVFATAIRHHLTVFDLQELELAYAPPYGSAKDPVNMAGFAAGNILKGLVNPIRWYEIEKADQDTILLDVRQPIEVRMGKIEGALNIPLNDLRDHLAELDEDKTINVYCAVGLRGYLACRILTQHGFKDVNNLIGGYRLYNSIMDDQNSVVESPDLEELTTASNPEAGQEIGVKIARKEE